MNTTATRLEIKKDEPLAHHCRFAVGGEADFFVEVTSAEEIREAIEYAKDQKLNFFVYSGGSNIFFDDKGFRGLVIRIKGGEYRILHDDLIYVDAGYPLPKLIRDLAREGLGGLEFLGNIPGSVGGAVTGNAGCYGRSISEVIQDARVLDVAKNRVLVLKPKDFEFAYRHSNIKYDPNKIILNLTLKTVPKNSQEIFDEIGGELGERLIKHPHNAMCAGSFFKNPEGKSAWQVITEAGLEGAGVGDAVLSPKHANFLLNLHQAKSQDILKLAHQIQKGVKQKLKIDLEAEVRYIGEMGPQEI